ncbi:MAG: DUF1963 domain-containing protein [Planctomycetes bacterium]|nr:DUF1963 domain-containing protein [Planctomycetota bacterium]
MTPVHERFDADRWMNMFSLETARNEARQFVLDRQSRVPQEYRSKWAVEKHISLMSPRWGHASSPRDVALNLNLRLESGGSTPPAGAVATDVFVFAVGEPPNPAATKFGGVPYWPSNRDWPETGDGQPAEFIGQINFRDSRDILPELPGDLLIAFGNDPWLEQPELMQFVWLDTSKDLPSHKGRANSNYLPVYGQIMRTWDHPEFFTWDATKVSGLPKWIQEDPQLPGRFLAVLNSVSGWSDKPWPFVNQEHPFTDTSGPSPFMYGDMGAIHIFADDEGKVSHDAAGY